MYLLNVYIEVSDYPEYLEEKKVVTERSGHNTTNTLIGFMFTQFAFKSYDLRLTQYMTASQHPTLN